MSKNVQWITIIDDKVCAVYIPTTNLKILSYKSINTNYIKT